MTGCYHRGHPYVVAGVILPHPDLSGMVRFMLDTSSELSLLSPTDALRIGCTKVDALSEEISWAAGRLEVGLEPATLIFDDFSVKTYSIDLRVILTEPVPDSRMPSILGMDVLSRLRTVMEPGEEVLRIDLKYPDMDLAETNLVEYLIRQSEQQSRNESGRS